MSSMVEKARRISDDFSIKSCEAKEANLHWNHVKSEDNTSDAGSRGVLPNELP